MKKISVVIPMYYEEQVAEECYERVSKVLYDLRYKYDYTIVTEKTDSDKDLKDK